MIWLIIGSLRPGDCFGFGCANNIFISDNAPGKRASSSPKKVTYSPVIESSANSQFWDMPSRFPVLIYFTFG